MEEMELLKALAKAETSEQVPSMEERLQDSIEKIINTANNSIAQKAGAESVKDVASVKDSYGNSLLAIGTDDKVASFTNYGLSNDTMNFPLWLALYNDSWVFKRAIDKPAQDEIRCGVSLQADGDVSEVYRKLKKHRSDFIQLLQWGALFGGSVACMMFSNLQDSDYGKPMNIDAVKKAKKMSMYVVDRWYGVSPSVETVTDMTDFDYGKPMYYDITLADGHSVRFHHSFVLRYEHRTAPKLVKNGLLQGWGYAEGSHILNELTRDDKLKATIQSLMNKALIEVIKMSGMRGVFMGASAENQEQLQKRLEMVNWARSSNSITFLDKEDEYEQFNFSGLSGLSDLLQQNMWLISSALEMQGVLFGDLKSGFSNDESALERYDETINNRCEAFLRPVYEKFITLLYRIYGIDEKVEFSFNSLLMKENNEKQVTSIKNFVELVTSLIDTGILDTQKGAKAIQTFVTQGTINLGLDDDYIETLKDKFEEEMENING